MIDIKPPEEKEILFEENFLERGHIVEKIAIDQNIAKELHEISNTLKDILREMRKRKV